MSEKIRSSQEGSHQQETGGQAPVPASNLEVALSRMGLLATSSSEDTPSASVNGTAHRRLQPEFIAVPPPAKPPVKVNRRVIPIGQQVETAKVQSRTAHRRLQPEFIAVPPAKLPVNRPTRRVLVS